MKIKILLFIILAMSFTCTLPAQTSIDSSKYVSLYIYRVHVPTSRNNTFKINIGDTSFKVKNNTKHLIKVYQEGEVKAWSKNETYKEVVLHTKFGEEYFIRCEVRPGAFAARPEIIIADARYAKEDIDKIP